LGEDFDKLDKTTQDVLTKWIKKKSNNDNEYKKALRELKDGLGLSALTGEIVAIGVLDYEKDEGVVYYQAPGAKEQESKKIISDFVLWMKKKCSKIFGMEQKVIRNL